MKLTKLDKLCQYCMKGGLCSHVNAPKPQHSRCIGKQKCEDYKQLRGLQAVLRLSLNKRR